MPVPNAGMNDRRDLVQIGRQLLDQFGDESGATLKQRAGTPSRGDRDERPVPGSERSAVAVARGQARRQPVITRIARDDRDRRGFWARPQQAADLVLRWQQERRRDQSAVAYQPDPFWSCCRTRYLRPVTCAPIFPLPGVAGVPGATAGRRSAACRAMQNGLEAGLAGPYAWLANQGQRRRRCPFARPAPRSRGGLSQHGAFVIHRATYAQGGDRRSSIRSH